MFCCFNYNSPWRKEQKDVLMLKHSSDGQINEKWLEKREREITKRSNVKGYIQGKKKSRRIRQTKWSISKFWRIFCCFSKCLTQWNDHVASLLTHTHTYKSIHIWNCINKRSTPNQKKKKAHKIRHENNRKSPIWFFCIYFTIERRLSIDLLAFWNNE